MRHQSSSREKKNSINMNTLEQLKQAVKAVYGLDPVSEFQQEFILVFQESGPH